MIRPMPTDTEYTIAELGALAGVTPRTVRYYISLGLLPSPGQVGPGTRYVDGHLRRVRLIRRLQAEHLPLAEIRGRLEGLDDEAVAMALEGPSLRATDSALDYIRALKGGGLPSASATPMAARMVTGMATPMATPEPSATSATSATRSQWERVSLSPDIELHIRRPLSRLENKRVERLIDIAREILEEDTP